MVVVVVKFVGIENEAIVEVVKNFFGVFYCLEYICRWNGVDFINDSKVINYDVAVMGLKVLVVFILLIVGGEVKEGNDNDWLW